MSGSSLDGLDIVYAEFTEQAGKWSYEIRAGACFPYPDEWKDQLSKAHLLNAKDYLLLHSAYGHYLGRETHRFIKEQGIEFGVALVSSHGHTVFHLPGQGMTSQLGDGAALAAELRLPVVTDLRALDVALGGQGAPIVPIGEKWLWEGHRYFLNIGGIANLSLKGDPYIAFDICPANRVLNMLAARAGKEYDEGGMLAASGIIDAGILDELNRLDYYERPFPKSLANDFGTDRVFPIVNRAASAETALRTYVEHIAIQLARAIEKLPGAPGGSMLVTGGGAFNDFLVERMRFHLAGKQVELLIPAAELVSYKEALVMAFIGILRWRQEVNVLASVTGAMEDSVGGALWMGGSL